MQITVSLTGEIPASADISEIETRVQTAGRVAMRQAVQQAVPPGKNSTPVARSVVVN
jgi:hypothetical protein